MTSLGDALDFGDLAYNDAVGAMGAASPTRGIVAGGSPSPIEDTINFVTISTLGNAADFGNLTDSRYSGGSCSNAVRAVFAGGWAPGHTDLIDYITIASLGDATDFGNLSQSRYLLKGAASPTRAIFAGGHRNPSPRVDTIDYIEIMTIGHALDFGDLLSDNSSPGATSNGHGGLG